MGYRSDVYAAIEFVDERSCDAWIVAAKLRSDANKWSSMFGHGERSTDGKLVIIRHEYVKWYDDFEDVQFFNDTLEWTHENFDCGYRTIRIGEADDDVEEDYNYPEGSWNDNLYDALQFCRSVDYGFPMTRTL